MKPDRNIGANKISLNQAIENYKQFGVSKPQHGPPFYADMDSIELIEKLSSVRSDLLSIYQDKLNKMIHHIEQNQLIHSANVWMCDEQKKTYQSYINIIKSKIR